MEARNRSLADWFTRIRTRQLVLPRFQRFEAWTYRNVSSLLDTVLSGLPAGALLILEIGDTEPFISRPVIGAPLTGDRIAEHLLDGQQRLTALWRSLNNNYGDRAFLVDTSPNDDDDSGPPYYRATSVARWKKGGVDYPVWLDDPTACWRRGLIPVWLLRPDGAAEDDFRAWARNATSNDAEKFMTLYQIGTELRSRFSQFNIPFLSLPAATPPDTALEVFVKMNTSAQPLSAYDIVVAQVEAGTGFSLHELLEELRKEAPGLSSYSDPADVIMGAGAYLMDKPARRGIMLGEGFAGSLIEHWDDLARGARRATAFLDEEGVYDSARLPTDPIVPILVALWAGVPDGLDREGEARRILHRFLWRAFLTDRYERASNTRALTDYKAIRDAIAGLDSEPAAIFDDQQHAPPTVDDLRSAGWPKKKERLARAMMLMALRQGGLDLADAGPVTKEAIVRREYHHLFPVSYLKEKGLPDSAIYRCVNCALVTWRTNRNIAAKAPGEYIRERADAATLGEKEIRRRLESHLVDFDLLVAGDYDRFMEDRATRMAGIAKNLCG